MCFRSIVIKMLIILYIKRVYYLLTVVIANIQPCGLHVEFYLILPAAT